MKPLSSMCSNFLCLFFSAKVMCIVYFSFSWIYLLLFISVLMYFCNFETDNVVHNYKQICSNFSTYLKAYLLNVDFCGFDSGLCVIFESLKISYLSPILYLLQETPLERAMKSLGRSCNLKETKIFLTENDF